MIEYNVKKLLTFVTLFTDAPEKLSRSKNVPFGFPEQDSRGEDKRRGLPGRIIAWDLALSDTTTPEVTSASVTHLTSRKDKRSPTPEDTAVQVTFISKNGINQGTEQPTDPTPSKAPNPKVRPDAQLDSQKNPLDPLDFSVEQGSKEKETEVPTAVSREYFGINAKYKSAKIRKVDLFKDTRNPADQKTHDPSAITLQREISQPIIQFKNLHSLKELKPPEQAGRLDELVVTQSNAAANRKELPPGVKVLNFMPLLIPCHQSVTTASTASTPVSASSFWFGG